MSGRSIERMSVLVRLTLGLAQGVRPPESGQRRAVSSACIGSLSLGNAGDLLGTRGSVSLSRSIGNTMQPARDGRLPEEHVQLTPS